MPNLNQILIIDDEIEVGTFLSRLLEKNGYHTSYAGTGADAFQLIASTGFAVALIDLKLPDTCGLDILRQLKNSQPDCEAIIMTGYATTKTAVKAIQLGAFDYIEKPFDDISEIEELVTKAFEYQRRITGQTGGQHEWQTIANRTGFVVGSTPKMVRLASVAEKIARKNINVLIQGETGTGKEVLARFIHAASNRRDHTFIPVNCGALPENLLESELFGHEKGAFTGATSLRRGIFEIADNGTLFLDEVGEASLSIQVKLLRVLETGEFLRVGGEKPVKTDVRIIAATNVDLEKAVKAKTFREDLFYRLDVIRLELPPLRERKEDIPPLLNLFISRTGSLQVSPEVTQALLNYDWPGNIRELVNLVDQAVALCDGSTILPSHLPDKIIPRNTEHTGGAMGDQMTPAGSPVDSLEAALQAVKVEQSLNEKNILKTYLINKQIEELLFKRMIALGVTGPLPPSLREIEIKAITDTLAFYDGNISTAARSLGIGRNTLYRKIKEYGLKI
ncbi:two-component system, NtrC family, response regulator [Desulfotomaculum arcticum]|uniref:Stage 0 sporulation protein A homolog n=1 Tax=Desulfotruncus arcticus DSM 17038 TaxID=1121424 RepID=A0A1I2R4A1_9FIRM|nr:sigma-54 dependent transcriptional regulator [Desulfotruncus arcticus]SFG34339.1 two-component system, NtrC family, response regulator [Desulfotomaculum arcticum] [Desulfotruncus arcticus DSM 17038]